MQMPLDLQGPNVTRPSPPQVTFIDKGSVTPLPLGSEEEQVQQEREEEPKQMATDEMSEEGHMVEYYQPPSQDTEVQATRSTKT